VLNCGAEASGCCISHISIRRLRCWKCRAAVATWQAQSTPRPAASPFPAQAMEQASRALVRHMLFAHAEKPGVPVKRTGARTAGLPGCRARCACCAGSASAFPRVASVLPACGCRNPARRGGGMGGPSPQHAFCCRGERSGDAALLQPQGQGRRHSVSVLAPAPVFHYAWLLPPGLVAMRLSVGGCPGTLHLPA
jgi:hypothetical protein